MTSCLCGIQLNYSQCCEPFIDGKLNPTTPETLMRSRYVAYALGKEHYLIQSWHPSTRPSAIDLSSKNQEKWLRLDIKNTVFTLGVKEGWVHFIAYFKFQEQLYALEETSRFLLENNLWYYVDGQHHTRPIKKGRNELCICLSGKKYKRCCGSFNKK